MSDKLFSVKDQVVLVTGGSRGIGKELASAFVRRDAHVIIAGRHKQTLDETATEISTPSNSVSAQICDVSSTDDVELLIESVISQHGRIDTLVSVAGINKRMKAERYTIDEYDSITDINAKGAWIIAQAVGRKMIPQGSGSIINISSVSSLRAGLAAGAYSAAKAAVNQFSMCAAMEAAPYGVRVNVVAPGAVETPGLNASVGKNEAMKTLMANSIPIQRLGTPEDLANTVCFLASDESTFITGVVLPVDGGKTPQLHVPDWELTLDNRNVK